MPADWTTRRDCPWVYSRSHRTRWCGQHHVMQQMIGSIWVTVGERGNFLAAPHP